jgi:hypothetical protein
MFFGELGLDGHCVRCAAARRGGRRVGKVMVLLSCEGEADVPGRDDRLTPDIAGK